MAEQRHAKSAALAREILASCVDVGDLTAGTKAKLERLVRMLGEVEPTEDLEARVSSWLGQQGFPLEFRVARSFARHGFRVTPSHYVSVDGEPREIDVLAVRTQHMMNVPMNLQFYVECKWSRGNPWVVFASEAASERSSPLWRAVPHNVFGEGVLWCMAEVDEFRSAPPIAALGIEGYAGRQALTARKPDDPDAFYSSMQSVTTLARWGAAGKPRADVQPAFELNLGFPVVVIEAPLYAASLPTDSDELRLERITRARIHWKGVSADVSSLVDVVTFDGLEDYLRDCTAGTKALFDWLGMAVSELSQALAANEPSPIAHRFLKRVISPPIVVPDILRGLATKYSAASASQMAP